MENDQPFEGFGQEGLDFLAGLREDNSKAYFEAHRTEYTNGLFEPAKAFVSAVGAELHARVSPDLQAVPKANGSLFRINRDVRFSADKTSVLISLILVLAR